VRLLLCLVCCSLIACGGSPPAPVEDRYGRAIPTSSRSPGSRVYYVQKGDTLYSIAFRFGLDFRRVAAANRIAAPYTIYPGQRIQLREATPAPVATAPTSQPRPAPSPGPTKTPAPVPGPLAKSNPAAKTPVAGKSATAAGSANSRGGAYTGGAVKAWRWPSSGRVTRGYSSSVHKGIDIAGNRGDPIKAVAAGKVVYAGIGIVGFGELLIVKHNEIYLSAYGHNDRLLVREGETVRAGQKIAEKGSTGTDTVKLHFEIRKEGKPVDPQRLLPRP